MDDPIVKALQKSTVHQALSAARASLAEPSRPYTPLDRSLFQQPDESERPSSSYGVDQLAFVRDTFGRPESRSGSRHGRVETISEAQVLRLDGSSSGEELTPVVARPARPPRPPQGGYPAASPKAATSPKRLGSSSPRRRLGSLREASPQRVPPMPVAKAPCEVVISKLQAVKASKDPNPVELSELCERLLVLAEELAAPGAATEHCAELLREVMGLMDLKAFKAPAQLFKLCRCALLLLTLEQAVQGVPVSGVRAAYQNIAQVLFKYSQKEGHDAEFMAAKLLEPLVEVLESGAEACASQDLRVYLVGILKNVSHDAATQKLLAQRGAVGALFRLLQAQTGEAKEVPLLIQVTATLRNLASHHYKQFLTAERLEALSGVMAAYPGHVELLTNVARAWAKLTLHTSACEALARSDAHVRCMASTLRQSSEAASLTLRLSFVLGNLTERSDRLRMVFAFDCEGTALVPELLGKYWQKERQEKGEAEEVLVKLVRLVANVAISPSAGPTLASCSALVEPLLDMLGAKRITESEELVLNVVAAITNLLFYDVPSNLLFQEENKQLLCRLFRPLLLESYNVEALIETARALGNLSRHADARQCMASLRLDEILVILLDHDDWDLVFYACGALVNLAADVECLGRLAKATPAVVKLAKLLADAPAEDPNLQLVAVKVLTNLSLDASAAWPSEDLQAVRAALHQTISESEALPDRGQLLELLRHLQRRLPEDGGATGGTGGTGTAEALDWFYCASEGCGRRFASLEKLQAHVERRHRDLE